MDRVHTLLIILVLFHAFSVPKANFICITANFYCGIFKHCKWWLICYFFGDSKLFEAMVPPPPNFCFVFLVHLFILWGRISFGPVPGFTTCYVIKDDFQYVIPLPPPKCWNFRWAPELTHQNCFLESLSRYLMSSTVTNLLKNQATVGWVGEKKGGKRLQFYCLEGIRT